MLASGYLARSYRSLDPLDNHDGRDDGDGDCKCADNGGTTNVAGRAGLRIDRGPYQRLRDCPIARTVNDFYPGHECCFTGSGRAVYRRRGARESRNQAYVDYGSR